MPIPTRKLTTTICVSGEGFDPQAFMGNQKDGGDCEVIDYEMDAGTMTKTMICRAQGGEMTMNTRGTYTDTGYSTTTEMEMQVDGETMKMTSKHIGKRIDDC